MLRALRRRQQQAFVAKHRARVLRWAARADRPWTPEVIERVTRVQARRHGACCEAHRSWEHQRNRAWVEWEFADDWDDGSGA